MPGFNLLEADRNTICAIYICPTCSHLLRDPVQTECGHLYCKSCINNFFIKDRVDMECLACGKRVTKDRTFLDKRMKREVSKLNVHCLNKDQGCTWEGLVSELENHTSVCELNQVSCPCSKCGKIVRNSELVAHLASECNYCLLMAAGAVASAVESDESGAVTSAKGGDATGAAAYVLGRAASSTGVERRTVSLRNNSNESDNTSRFPITDLASTTQAEIERRLVNVENKAADHDILLVENSKSVEDVRRQNSYLQRQLELSQENVRRLERRVESQDHMLALRNVALADLEEYIRQQEVSSYDGILLWKISDFARRRSDAQGGRQTSFYSPSFYTSRHGYKLCAKIYLNGVGMGKGTHISLFFVVMRGQYDSLLRWPFRQKVNLMILDQDNMEHVIDAFRPDPNSSSFQKPRREMNIASGCPLFFPLSALNTHAYVRDDTMFVKIIVDTSYL